MKQTINCYRNWRIAAVLLLGALALLLATDESKTLLTNIIGAALLLADFLVARKWHREGRLHELDNITE